MLGHGRLDDSSLKQGVSGMLLSVIYSMYFVMKGRHIVCDSNFKSITFIYIESINCLIISMCSNRKLRWELLDRTVLSLFHPWNSTRGILPVEFYRWKCRASWRVPNQVV